MKERNTTIDIIRGFAMLLVVLGHTISGSVKEYSNSLIYQFIWTLQIPLFIIISGYLTHYSRPLKDLSQLWHFAIKRIMAYLFPWAVWTFIVRGIVFGQTEFLDLRHLLWHMDSGYWFLATIWTISMIYGISDVLSNVFFNRKSANVISHLLLSAVMAMGLAFVGWKVGINFFSIKLSLYYMTFYMLGYLYGQYQEWFSSLPNSETIKNCIVVVSLGVWLSLITRIDFYSGIERTMMIMVRFAASVLGCITVIGLLSPSRKEFGDGGGNLEAKRYLLATLNWVGTHSIEVYLIHDFTLNLLTYTYLPPLHSAQGIILIICNFFMTVALSCIYIKIIEKNKVLNKILFWK